VRSGGGAPRSAPRAAREVGGDHRPVHGGHAAGHDRPRAAPSRRCSRRPASARGERAEVEVGTTRWVRIRRARRRRRAPSGRRASLQVGARTPSSPAGRCAARGSRPRASRVGPTAPAPALHARVALWDGPGRGHHPHDVPRPDPGRLTERRNGQTAPRYPRNFRKSNRNLQRFGGLTKSPACVPPRAGRASRGGRSSAARVRRRSSSRRVGEDVLRARVAAIFNKNFDEEAEIEREAMAEAAQLVRRGAPGVRREDLDLRRVEQLVKQRIAKGTGVRPCDALRGPPVVPLTRHPAGRERGDLGRLAKRAGLLAEAKKALSDRLRRSTASSDPPGAGRACRSGSSRRPAVGRPVPPVLRGGAGEAEGVRPLGRLDRGAMWLVSRRENRPGRHDAVRPTRRSFRYIPQT
jgi:hypothetical protein